MSDTNTTEVNTIVEQTCIHIARHILFSTTFLSWYEYATSPFKNNQGYIHDFALLKEKLTSQIWVGNGCPINSGPNRNMLHD